MRDPRPTDAIFRDFPGGIATPELALPLPEGDAERIMARVIRLADGIEDLTVQTIDGLRLDGPAGWGLVRASNTLPKLVFRFEGDDSAALRAMQERFRMLIAEAAPGRHAALLIHSNPSNIKPCPSSTSVPTPSPMS